MYPLRNKVQALLSLSYLDNQRQKWGKMLNKSVF